MSALFVRIWNILKYTCDLFIYWSLIRIYPDVHLTLVLCNLWHVSIMWRVIQMTCHLWNLSSDTCLYDMFYLWLVIFETCHLWCVICLKKGQRTLIDANSHWPFCLSAFRPFAMVSNERLAVVLDAKLADVFWWKICCALIMRSSLGLKIIMMTMMKIIQVCFTFLLKVVRTYRVLGSRIFLPINWICLACVFENGITCVASRAVARIWQGCANFFALPAICSR